LETLSCWEKLWAQNRSQNIAAYLHLKGFEFQVEVKELIHEWVWFCNFIHQGKGECGGWFLEYKAIDILTGSLKGQYDGVSVLKNSWRELVFEGYFNTP